MKFFKLKSSLIFFSIIFSAIFFVGNSVLATEYHEFGQTGSGTNVFGNTNGYRYIGQRWVASSTNLSSVIFDTWDAGGIGETLNCGNISVCEGIPNNLSQADIATNGIDCNWGANTQLLTESFNLSDQGDFFYKHTFSSPVDLTPSEDYYIILDTGDLVTCNKYVVTWTANTGRIINDGQWPESMAMEGFYDDEYGATTDYYYSNDTDSSGIEYNAVEDLTIYTVNIPICKEEDNDNGVFGLMVWDNTNDYIMATSSQLYDMDTLTYYATPCNDHLQNFNFQFIDGFNVVADQDYQFQLYRTDNGITLSATTTPSSNLIVSTSSPQYYGILDDTAEYFPSGYLSVVSQPFFYLYDDVIEGLDGENVFNSSSNFGFPQILNCEIASSTPCIIEFMYSSHDVGATLFLLPKNEYSVLSATDSIQELQDKPFLSATTTPVTRSSETTDYYMYYIDRETIGYIAEHGAIASSSLHLYTRVNWVVELTESLENTNKFFKLWAFLKTIFPLSVVFQITDTIYNITHNTLETNYVDISFDDLVADEYKENIGTTTMILDHNTLSDTLPIWDNYLYPFMEMIVYLINFILVIFLILPGKQSAGSEGL